MGEINKKQDRNNKHLLKEAGASDDVFRGGRRQQERLCRH
jgi:hypothetical protein